MTRTAANITRLRLIKSVAQPKWVRASVIADLTGWNGDRLKQARIDGSIESRRDKNGTIWYDMNSLHPYHLKSEA
jgi:hypothetical protein